MFNKVLVGAAGTTIAVGGGVGTYLYLNKEEKETITNRLTNEGFKPLTLLASDADFKAILAKYKGVTNDPFDNSKKGADATAETLIANCTKALSAGPKDDKNHKLARQWCVKEISIKDILAGGRWKILDSTGDGNIDAGGHWAKKVTDHKASTSENKIPAKLTGSNNAEHIAAMKQACKTLNIAETKTTNAEFNKQFEQAKEWCAIETKKAS